VIGSRLDRFYAWSARELGQPGLVSLARCGAPVYAWPCAARRVWQLPDPSVAVRLLRVTTAP
jgi:hypothetical protein